MIPFENKNTYLFAGINFDKEWWLWITWIHGHWTWVFVTSLQFKHGKMDYGGATARF